MDDKEFQGRIAIVTGGGRGFGKAFGHALAARGATVVLTDIDAQAGQDAAAEISAAGGSASAITCDVADEKQVAAMVDKVVGKHGGIDILINNAGLHSHAYNRPMADIGVAGLRRLFDVNVMGVVICSLAARQAMRGRPGAAIVSISSSASYLSGNAYGVSKLAVRGLTMTLAREFASDGIRANAISPGLILTDTIRAELSPETVKNIVGQQLLSREGSEQDIVDTMLYLVSARSGFMTGETLRVSGGYALSMG
ncbi:MAG: SDR family oxidoreductase [Rhodospirillaceae bacterium]|nr:MAG: SDR family oxidoreductase [Rhodospirillaceae bacterium]